MIKVEFDSSGSLVEREVDEASLCPSSLGDEREEGDNLRKDSPIEVMGAHCAATPDLVTSEDDGEVSSSESTSSAEEPLAKQWGQDLQRLQLRIKQVLQDPTGEEKDLAALEQDFRTYREKWRVLMANLPPEEHPVQEQRGNSGLPVPHDDGPPLLPPQPVANLSQWPSIHSRWLTRPMAPLSANNLDYGGRKHFVICAVMFAVLTLIMSTKPHRDQQLKEEIGKNNEYLLDEAKKRLSQEAEEVNQFNSQLESLIQKQHHLGEELAFQRVLLQENLNLQDQLTSLDLRFNQLNQSMTKLVQENERLRKLEAAFTQAVQGILPNFKLGTKSYLEDFLNFTGGDLRSLVSQFFKERKPFRPYHKPESFKSKLKSQAFNIFHYTKNTLMNVHKSMQSTLENIFSNKDVPPKPCNKGKVFNKEFRKLSQFYSSVDRLSSSFKSSLEKIFKKAQSILPAQSEEPFEEEIHNVEKK